MYRQVTQSKMGFAIIMQTSVLYSIQYNYSFSLWLQKYLNASVLKLHELKGNERRPVNNT